MARRVLLPACLLAACLLSLQLAPSAFVPPTRRGAAAGAAAALAGLAATAPEPAEAVTAKFSVFGFGDGSSDPYMANDADAISPYSQFSNPKDAIYKKGTAEIVARRKEQLDNSFGRLEKIPQLLVDKNKENVKSILTLQLYTMRSNMEYLSGETDSEAFQKAREFFQDVAQIGVNNFQNKFDEAQDSYAKAQSSLGEWKSMVQY